MNRIKEALVVSAVLRSWKIILRNWDWVFLIVLTIGIRLFASAPEAVELYYSQGVYPAYSGLLRSILNWLPLSLGDLLYGVLAFMGIGKAVTTIRRLSKGNLHKENWLAGLRKFCFIGLTVYLVFNISWGLNYNRLGIGSQLALQPTVVDAEELDSLTAGLLHKTNSYSIQIDTTAIIQFKNKAKLFSSAAAEVNNASFRYPFLKGNLGAVKPSLYSYLGNYLGFQGYYNPFTGEGQVNTTIPVFLQPFVATHEIAHQLGYAKESEANFVGFLVCKEAKDPLFRYAAYLDMYLYAHAILYQVDSTRANQLRLQRSAQVQLDIQTLKSFYQQYQNPIEELVMQGYDYFLRANEQPQGTQSYSQVLRWLMAWVRKNGWEAL
ncbi:MAG: DUF3810 domain-containing protein [Bacteroidetes bacterium]|nr:DUF3810 domain-containing protein [Bacteroidota bacterium]